MFADNVAVSQLERDSIYSNTSPRWEKMGGHKNTSHCLFALASSRKTNKWLEIMGITTFVINSLLIKVFLFWLSFYSLDELDETPLVKRGKS